MSDNLTNLTFDFRAVYRRENACKQCLSKGKLVDPEYKFSFGGDSEGRFMTTVYQCPECRDVIVRKS